ncbi:Sapep family Mn(2+)-dependent dipeptidase [Enterocloster lavalensis]|uniref:Sapep family Mn(2+)-dependent dipeptidase n=1 Tax=Enterocloster lavalensis TaxID=460384 RepID=UPI001D08A64B|nr:Sapep family Mn(2+)-dependent dipeptidase [Enterocloster lavalensis]MCB6345295.1 Sapep family Mn(2+)-dependent dipeptidase [Enterocloster lavalensis]
MDKDLCQKIREWVDAHEEAVISDVRRLVSIGSVAELDSSVPPYGQACRDVMEEYCKIAVEHGYCWTSYDDRVIRVDTGEGDGQPDIGIWNHLDVVPAGHDWKYEPYGLTVDGGCMIGRGVKDNKGPAVAAIYAVRCLQELGVELKHKISFYAGLEEEKGMTDIHWLTDHQVELPKMNIVLDSRYPVCHGEKGILGITVANKNALSGNILEIQGGESENSVAGRARMVVKAAWPVQAPAGLPDWLSISWEAGKLTIETKGLSKHAAHAEGSENAIHRLFCAVSGREPSCKALRDLLGGSLDKDTLKLFEACADISAGIYGDGLGIAAEDGISGRLTAVASLVALRDHICSLTFNIRYPITMKEHSGLVEKIGATAAGLDMEVASCSGKAPGYFPAEHPMIESLMNTYNEFLGRDEKPFTMAGGTYARLLPNAFGYGFRLVPETAYPEGLIPEGHGGSHSADEAVPVELYKQQLTLFILSLAEGQKVELS